jgi:hypothetical protein
VSAGEPAEELLRIVRGRPTPEELAAVSVVLYALAGQRRERQAEQAEKEYWDLVAADGLEARSVLRRLRGGARSWTATPFPTWRAWRG